MNANKKVRRAYGAFTLIELIIVVVIITLLLAMLLPSLGRARRSARSAVCNANLRSMALAQITYANTHNDLLVMAGDGSYDVQGSWIRLLEDESAPSLVRRCPSDESPYFNTPFTAYDPPVLRVSSYGINNYVSPTHIPLGAFPYQRLSQIRRPSGVIQFVELAETGNYAVSDHIHVQEFYNPLTPEATPTRVNTQMPLGRHGGQSNDWSGILNYSFLDSHAEALPLRHVYEDPNHNRFNPAIAP